MAAAAAQTSKYLDRFRREEGGEEGRGGLDSAAAEAPPVAIVLRL